MRLYQAAVLVTAMMGFACNISTSSGGGGGGSTPTGYDTVEVVNCSDKAINVFSRKATNGGGPWSEHGSIGTFQLSNGKCDESNAMANAITADIGDGEHLVRAVVIDFNSSCDSSDPDGLCTKREGIYLGDNSSSKSATFKVTLP
ncbi:MAG: hypothetical protein RIT81_16865 [Deltaproteobacteria bacterium]